MKRFVKKISSVNPMLPKKKPVRKKETKITIADDVIDSYSNASIYTLKADGNLLDYGDAELPNLDYEPQLKKVTSMEITWLTNQEIENMATVVVKSSKTTGEGSVYDPRFGVIVNFEKCLICGMGWRWCAGHPGVIKFPYPIPHPMRLKQLADYLTCVCSYCHRLVINWKQMKTLGILRYKGENRYKAYFDVAKKTIRCKSCGKPHGKYSMVDDKFFKSYKRRSEIKKLHVSYEEVVKIISNIREKEFQLIGFTDPLCHPKNLIINNLYVLPSCCRPYVESNNNQMHDDMTHKYIEIVKVVTKLSEKGLSEKGKLDLTDTLMFHVKTLMDNSKNKARDPNGKRSIRSIKQRVSGKQGHVRQNMQGKRTHSCARSAISPDPDMPVDCVGVPQEIADKLTFPEKVSAFNIKWCQQLLDTDRVNHIKRGDSNIDARFALYTRGFKLKEGDIVIRGDTKIIPTSYYDFKILSGDNVVRSDNIMNEMGQLEIKRKVIKGVEPPRRKTFLLREGDIIERKLQNGDQGIFNRQPTLHEPSFRAKTIKIIQGKTLQFGLADTGAYGADFDGDEMNLFIAQSQSARAEMHCLMNTEAQFISSADSKPILGMKQDAMVGGYIYTLGRVYVSKHTFMDACCLFDLLTIDQIVDKMEHIRNVHKWLGNHNDEIVKILQSLDQDKKYVKDSRELLSQLKIDYTLAKNLKDVNVSDIKQQFESLKTSILQVKEKIHKIVDESSDRASDALLYTGHSIISMLLPSDFEYEFNNKLSPDNKNFKVTRGVLISGTINKPALMNMIHHLYKDYGAKVGCDFVTYYQRIMNILLGRRGFSVGLADCTPKNTDIIEQEQEKCFLQAKVIMETEPDLETRELKILSTLNKATDIGERIVRDKIDPNNNFMHMIISGAKGSIFNYVNSVNSVGQQNLSGKRAPKDYGGRTLPCYESTPGSQYSPDVIKKNNVLTDTENITRIFQSRGYITSSFHKGLTSQEFFFLSAGGREGLIDTSVKTARCGYLSRRMLKLLEDVKISYNGNVVNTKGTVVQFCYGDDNFSASELIKTSKYGMQCSDIEHIAEELNKDYEYDAWKENNID
jgi:DNA-directed RNA polymerase II subunit RPB1